MWRTVVAELNVMLLTPHVVLGPGTGWELRLNAERMEFIFTTKTYRTQNHNELAGSFTPGNVTRALELDLWLSRT